jgi:hypothetical protein
MKIFISIVILLVILLRCSTNSNSPTDFDTNEENDTGTIEGKIVLANEYKNYSEEVGYATVRILGSQFDAVTDSQGNYSISGLPEASYTIYAQSLVSSLNGFAYDVAVESGKVTTVPDIVLDYHSYYYEGFYIYNLVLKDSLDQYYGFSSMPMIVYSKSIRIIGRVGSYTEANKDTCVSIRLNGIRHLVSTDKQMFTKNLNLHDGLNELILWIGDAENPGSVADTGIFYYAKSLNKVKVSLDWSSSDYGFIDAGDFDLYLVNEQIGDTCWYKKLNPDWGILDFPFDDPFLHGDDNSLLESYGYEFIDIANAAEGTYTIMAHYYTNRSDLTTKITPTIYVSLKNDFEQEITCPNSMEVGDMWIVGQFTYPFGNNVDIINKIDQKTE